MSNETEQTKATLKKMAELTKEMSKLREDLLRRPAAGETMPLSVARMLVQDFTVQRDFIELFAAHLRSLDRRRINGMGIKRQGFADRAYDLALRNTEFLPHWIPIAKYTGDHDLFTTLRAGLDTEDQVREMMWNLVMVAADVYYTDGLEFYSQVQDAAKRRVDAAESPDAELAEFFASHGKKGEDHPTEKDINRDIHALEEGKKNGEVVIESHKPEEIGGEKKMVDETFKKDGSIKKTEDGSYHD